MLKELVKERLMAAADEIFALFERTIASYEEELSRTREKERQLQRLEDACKTQTVSHAEDAQQLIGRQEEHPPQGERSTLKQEDSQAPHIKEEERDLWITQDGACLLGPDEFDLNELQLTVVPVKTEDHEDKPPESSQLHHSPGEEDRGAEPPSGSSPQHMTTEADGDHCGGSQADNLLAPLSDSDDTTSHSPEDEDENDAQEPLSSDTDWEGDMRTQTDKKHSKKKTGKKCFNCLVCDRSFSHKGIFSRHMRTHTGEKRFCCSICSKPFSLKSNMVSHMRIHTGEKPFSCSICGDTFVQRSTLTSHMRTHTGEKPFSCSVCGDKFSQRSNLNGHKRTHTGEKPFSCAFCGKSFSCRSNMNAHMRTHTGEKPFSCPACGQMFSRKTKMTAHMLTHNGE